MSNIPSSVEHDRKMICQCRMCQQCHVIVVAENDFTAWRDGKFVQDAFPYLSKEDRELLVSQTCNECWYEMFGDCCKQEESDEELEEYATVSWTRNDVTGLAEWNPDWSPEVADRFLEQHAKVLRDQLLYQGNLVLLELLSTWEDFEDKPNK
jgi:hypothetical protein